MRRGLLASIEELKSLRDRISRKPFDAIYDILRRRCALILQSAPVTEMQWRSLSQQGQSGAAVQAAQIVQGRIMDLLIAHHVEPNPAYRDRAIEELKQLIGWSTWVDPSSKDLPADVCTAEAAVAAVVALDWLWDDLSSPDRLRVLRAVRNKALVPFRQGVQQGASWYSCSNNWNAVVNSGCGLAGLALSDEEVQAEEAYRMARSGLRRFFDAFGREGGWEEGCGYWGYAMRYLLLLGEAASRINDDQTIFHSRGMDATGLFPVYFSPNGRPASFGDYPVVPLHGALYLLVKYFGGKELTWWLDSYAFRNEPSANDSVSAGLALLFRPIDAEVTQAPDLSQVRVFKEIGWACMADSWPRPKMYVAAKAGDLSANHSHCDMNSIQLQVDGEMMLVDLCHLSHGASKFSLERGDSSQARARSHNTIIVAQRDHEIYAQGDVIEAQADHDYRWIACDAGAACGENVQFIRNVVMLLDPSGHTGQTVVVLDEVNNAVPDTADLYWHTQGRIELNDQTLTGRIVGTSVALNFALLSTGKASAKLVEKDLLPAGDNAVELSAGVMGKAFFASVFSRAKLPDKFEIKKSSNGELKVKLGTTQLHFKLLRKHLQLTGVVNSRVK